MRTKSRVTASIQENYVRWFFRPSARRQLLPGVFGSISIAWIFCVAGCKQKYIIIIIYIKYIIIISKLYSKAKSTKL